MKANTLNIYIGPPPNVLGRNTHKDRMTPEQLVEYESERVLSRQRRRDYVTRVRDLVKEHGTDKIGTIMSREFLSLLDNTGDTFEKH